MNIVIDFTLFAQLTILLSIVCLFWLSLIEHTQNCEIYYSARQIGLSLALENLESSVLQICTCCVRTL